jgi:uncharacterized Ntn-hydrolase superfamily protein
VTGRTRQGTYSIVARDAETGELGVAVQSHWFSVGSIVPWAAPGVGAVATQANVEIAYGPRLLTRLGQGAAADQALAELVAGDSAAHTRQVAVVGSGGEAAAHTGSGCVPFAGHGIGEQFTCQANMMSTTEVWPAMARAFHAHRGDFAERLLAALRGAEQVGGDIRGRQSAALLIVPAAGESWEARVSLRVEDHPEPLLELRRLLDLHGAYALAGRADGLVAEGRLDEAAALYRAAAERAPDSHELLFWSGLGAAQGGDIEAGLGQVREAIARHAGWAELLLRLTDEMAPGVSAVRARLRSAR